MKKMMRWQAGKKKYFSAFCQHWTKHDLSVIYTFLCGPGYRPVFFDDPRKKLAVAIGTTVLPLLSNKT
jgi:hypothetical protein